MTLRTCSTLLLALATFVVTAAASQAAPKPPSRSLYVCSFELPDRAGFSIDRFNLNGNHYLKRGGVKVLVGGRHMHDTTVTITKPKELPGGVTQWELTNHTWNVQCQIFVDGREILYKDCTNGGKQICREITSLQDAQAFAQRRSRAKAGTPNYPDFGCLDDIINRECGCEAQAEAFQQNATMWTAGNYFACVGGCTGGRPKQFLARHCLAGGTPLLSFAECLLCAPGTGLPSDFQTVGPGGACEESGQCLSDPGSGFRVCFQNQCTSIR